MVSVNVEHGTARHGDQEFQIGLLEVARGENQVDIFKILPVEKIPQELVFFIGDCQDLHFSFFLHRAPDADGLNRLACLVCNLADLWDAADDVVV